jgi:hypothetical protein
VSQFGRQQVGNDVGQVLRQLAGAGAGGLLLDLHQGGFRRGWPTRLAWFAGSLVTRFRFGSVHD